MDFENLSDAQLEQMKSNIERQLNLSDRIGVISRHFHAMAQSGKFDPRYLDIAHKALMDIEPLNIETENMRDEICKTLATIRSNIKSQ